MWIKAEYPVQMVAVHFHQQKESQFRGLLNSVRLEEIEDVLSSDDEEDSVSRECITFFIFSGNADSAERGEESTGAPSSDVLLLDVFF